MSTFHDLWNNQIFWEYSEIAWMKPTRCIIIRRFAVGLKHFLSDLEKYQTNFISGDKKLVKIYYDISYFKCQYFAQ